MSVIIFRRAPSGEEVGRWTRTPDGTITATPGVEGVLRSALGRPDPWGRYSNWSNGYYVSREISDESKALPRDGDGDGLIYDGTPRERPAPVPDLLDLFKRAKLSHNLDNGGNSNKGIQVWETPDGKKILRKTMKDSGDVDREVLAARVGEALRTPIPRVVRWSDNQTLHEFAEGELPHSAADEEGYDDDDQMMVYDDAIQSDAGRELGLFDYLIDNIDRHDLNWLIDANGDPVGIDHGRAFWGHGASSPFTEAHLYSFTDSEELAEIRERLEALRNDFLYTDDLFRADRTSDPHPDWWNGMMERLAILEAEAEESYE